MMVSRAINRLRIDVLHAIQLLRRFPSPICAVAVSGGENGFTRSNGENGDARRTSCELRCLKLLEAPHRRIEQSSVRLRFSVSPVRPLTPKPPSEQVTRSPAVTPRLLPRR